MDTRKLVGTVPYAIFEQVKLECVRRSMTAGEFLEMVISHWGNCPYYKSLEKAHAVPTSSEDTSTPSR